MPRALQLAVFLLVACSIILGLHYYFWARLVRDAMLAAPWRHRAVVAIIVLAVALPLSMPVVRFLPRTVSPLLAYPVYVWMGVMFQLFLLLLAGDLVRGLFWLAERSGGTADPARRQFMSRAIAAVAAGGAVGIGALGVRNAKRPVAVKDVEVKLTRLPAALSGLTIAQLTDLHIGPTIGGDWMRQVVDRVNALAPDVVAITGDIVDGSVAELREHVAPLADLRARYGVYAVTGNHEYYSGVGEWLGELARLGIRVLRNERVEIGPAGGPTLDLAGVDDFKSRRMSEGHGADLPRALAGRDPSREVVLLAHQPKAIHEASELGVGLQLSGHTHGGQIWPFTYLVYLQQPFVAGLARVRDTWLYVSAGTGYWGPPMRVGTSAEITKITLRA